MEKYMIRPWTPIRFLISSMDVVEGDIYLAIGLINSDMALEFEFEGMDAIIVGCDGIDGEVIIPRTVSIEGDDGGCH